jgi:hypothetical protein
VEVFKHSVVLATVLVLIYTAGLSGQADAGVYNLHLATDNAPDYTDLDSFVRSATGHLDTPQEKCIAVWRWGRRSRRQTSCSKEDGRLIWDPILHYNSYGTMNCGIISALNMVSWLELGYKARYIQLGDHTVSEVSWDGGANWHLFDSSMSFFCYNDRGVVASCEEIKASHGGEFSEGVDEPGHYYYYHGAPQCITHRGKDGWRCCSDNPVAYQRTLLNGASSYTGGFSVDKYTLHVRRGHRYILNLLPGQSYTRYWKPLDASAPGEDKRDYYRSLDGKDPDEQHDLHNIRGNGLWLFEPDLRNADCRYVFYDSENIEVSAEHDSGPALHLAKSGQPAHVVFKVSAANVITSMQITGEGVRTATDDILRVLVSRCAGIRWTPVWQSSATGSQSIELRLRDEVAGVTECLVKVEFSTSGKTTDVGLNRFKLKTITQLNRRTLPKLTLGSNQVRLSADRQVDTTVLWPALHNGQYKTTVFSEKDVYSDEEPDGMYKATLGAGKDGTPCEVVWRVEVPTDISGVTYGAVATNKSPNDYVSLQYSHDGLQFREFYRKADGDAPFDKQVLHTCTAEQIPSHARQAFFKSVFFSKGGAAAYTMAGIQDVLIQVEHQPRAARFQPIEITYNWTEHRASGEVTRSHTELVDSLPAIYTINVAGRRDPTMNWVRMNLKSDAPRREPVVYGYSDGEDVGDSFEPESRIFSWGKNIALGRAYTSSRASSKTSNNPDTDGAELTNGKIIAPTDYVSSEIVQAATAFWEPGEPVTFVVDLGRAQIIGAVRISTHQPNSRYCHPRQIDVVVSDDGEKWQPAGAIEHDDLWRPPGDYEPWEHDDNPKYNDLPAGGRLAYSYPLAFERPLTGRYVRIICTPLEGCGIGISEIEVFDKVEVSPAPPLVAPL